jgi:hypothetical protein
MLGLAGILALAIGATEVTVQPGTPCLAQGSLARKLRAAGVRLSDTGTDATLVVTLSGEGHQLLVRARRGDLRFERRVPAGLNDCAAVERVTVALISAWSAAQGAEAVDAGVTNREPPSVAVDAGPLPPDVGPGTRAQEERALAEGFRPRTELASRTKDGGLDEVPSRTPDDGARPRGELASRTNDGGLASPDETASRTQGEHVRLPAGTASLANERRLASRDAVASREVGNREEASPAKDGGGASTAEVDEIPPATEGGPPLGLLTTVDAGLANDLAPPPGSALRFEVAVLGGLSAGPTRDVAATGEVLASFSSGRWGVLLEVGLDSERAARVEPVRASAELQWLSASLRVAFEPLSALTVDLALGARGWRIAARATGVDVATDKTQLSAGPALSAGLSYRLLGPLFVHFRPFVALRAQAFSFNVEPLGRILLLEPWSGGATLGALLRFD